MMVINNINDLNETLSVHVDDRSYRYRRIMADDKVFLYFSLPEFIEILPGAWITYQGAKYTMNKPADFKKNHSRHYDYTLEFDSPAASLLKYRLRDVVERRLKFPLLANARQHLQMIVDNLNMRESGWTMGSCIETPAKLISYNHTTLAQALQMVADNFETEFEIVEKEISLGRIERNQSDPIALSYGKGNGFLPGVGRFNDVESAAIKVLHVQGGARNINRSSYGSPTLLLPASQSLQYEGSLYEVSADGHTVSLSDAPAQSPEGSLDLADIYPSRVGEISQVIPVNPSGNFYDFVDSSIPEGLDFNDCHMPGEKMTVIFQSGMLAGREFEISAYKHALRRFEIVPAQEDGLELPSGPFVPAVGDTYAIFGIELPAAYIREDSTQSGASWDMLREAVRYLHDNSRPKFSFTGTLDGIWAKKDWLNIGGRIQLGSYVLFSDPTFEPAGVHIRIVGIKDFVNSPESPELELSNNVISSSFTSRLAKIEQNEVVTQELHRQSMSFTKRRFNDAAKTISMLEQAFSNNFTKAISPAAVHTMAALVGDESLQFRFVNSTANPQEVTHVVTYNQSTLVLNAPAGIIQHMTLGLESISPGHQTSEYHFWNVAAFNSPPLSNPESSYYLYIKANKASMAASFALSETPIGFEQEEGYYHLLVGILNAELAGERSYVSLYGFTEILPGRITTNKIVSADGNTFIDLQTGDIQGKFTFRSGRDVEEVVEEVADSIDAVQVGGRNLLRNTGGFQNLSAWTTNATEGSITIASNVDGVPAIAFAAGTNGMYQLVPVINLVNGGILTVSFWAKAIDTASEVRVGFLNQTNMSVIKTITAGWAVYQATFAAPMDTSKNTFFHFYATPNTGAGFYIKNIKLELGNRATDWTPAPEDVDADIATAKQEALTAAAAAQTTANTANATVGNLNTYVDGAFKDGVIDAAEAKAIEKYKNTLNETMAKAEASYNKVYTNTYLEGTAKTSLLNAKVNLWGQKDTLLSAINTAISGGTTTPAQKTAVDSAFSTFNNLMTAFQNALEEANRAIQVKLDNISKGYADAVQVGGRNLLRNTGGFQNLSAWTTNATGGSITIASNVDGVPAIAFAAGTNGMYQSVPVTNLVNGGIYTVSFWAKAIDTASEVRVGFLNQTNMSVIKTITAGWAVYQATFAAPMDTSKNTFFHFYGTTNTGAGFYIKNIKLEKGTKATDWTPAPEDVPSSLEYLAEAMQGDTSIAGGLVATNLLQVKDLGDQVRGGMSGLANDNIGFWSGGTYQEALDGTAKIIFRKDGSHQLASGIIQSTVDGDTQIGDVHVDASGALVVKEGTKNRVLITKDDITTLAAIASSTQNTTVNNSAYQHFPFPPSGSPSQPNVITVNNNGTQLTVTGSFGLSLATNAGQRNSQATLSAQVYLRKVGDGWGTGVRLASGSVTVNKLMGQPMTDNFSGRSLNKVAIVSAGQYRIVADYTYNLSGPGPNENSYYTANLYIEATSMHALYDGAYQRNEIGKNGIGVIIDANNYSFFGKEGGSYKIVEKTTGVYDRPGVLLAGRMEGGAVIKSWGAKYRKGSYREGNNIYRIHHNIGHEDYSVQLTPQSDARMWVIQRATTYCRIQASAATLDFDFAMFGDNK